MVGRCPTPRTPGSGAEPAEMTSAHKLPATRGNPLPVSTSIFGIAVDMVLLYILLTAGVSTSTAGMASMLLAATGVYLLRNRADVGQASATDPLRAGWFALAVLLTIFLRAGVLAWMQRISGNPVVVTAAVVAVTAGMSLRAAIAFRPDLKGLGRGQVSSWRYPVMALLTYAVLLRLTYMGLPELIHEEAYYWNYSRHLALGYLDHPPMVAWIIRSLTALLGHTELGVRAGAALSWFVGSWFVFKLTRCVYDSATAICAVLLYAVFPAYFTVGMIMTPEAPLFACWAGALYFLYRALIDEVPAAWLGAGIFIGAGMLSKYTMVLLGGSVIAFMLVDAGARRWFRRASPYEAAGIALLLFSPVIVWNFQHDWISFAFQGPQRAAGLFEFSLPVLLGNIAALLTPLGLVAVAVAVFSRSQLAPGGSSHRSERFFRGFRLLTFSTLLPLSMFVLFSLFRHTKLNWTGPLWIGVLPYLARTMAIPWRDNAGPWRKWLSPRIWRITAIGLLLTYGAGLQYLTLGLLGTPYPQNDTGMVALGWEDLAAKIETTVEQVERETGKKPLVVGMESDRLSSWLAFYRSRAMASGVAGNTGAAALDTGGPNLFGRESHMYKLWFPSSQQNADRPMVLVASSLQQLDIHSERQWAGPVGEVTAEKNGQLTWRVYYRVLY
jgi:dolichol-phosphate mannosyltransferase